MSSREPPSLRSLLPAFLGRLARDGGPVSALQPVWEEVVGPQLAAHVRPAALQGDTLVVLADSVMWAGALEAQARKVVERLTERHASLGVKRVQVRLA